MERPPETVAFLFAIKETKADTYPGGHKPLGVTQVTKFTDGYLG
jgi:hypothetical protein